MAKRLAVDGQRARLGISAVDAHGLGLDALTTLDEHHREALAGAYAGAEVVGEGAVLRETGSVRVPRHGLDLYAP